MSRYNYFNDVQAYEELEPEGAIRAKLLNEQYDFSSKTTTSSILNLLKGKGIWS